MEETERTSANDILLQGDILRIDGDQSQFGFDLAMIINADCDMQNGKHDGMIAILPIYTFQQYLERFWLQNFLVRQKHEAISQLRANFEIENSHIGDLLEWFSQDREEVLRRGAAEIFEKYKLAPKQIVRADESLSKLHKFYEVIDRGRLSAVSKFAPSEPEKARKFCRDQVVEAKKQMGDDHFFITEVKNHMSVGYVIRMRRIYTIPVDACFGSESAMLSSPMRKTSAYRICRLTAHYKFKASQLFAYQYSRIGLPDEVTALSDLAISDMANHFQDDRVT